MTFSRRASLAGPPQRGGRRAAPTDRDLPVGDGERVGPGGRCCRHERRARVEQEAARARSGPGLLRERGRNGNREHEDPSRKTDRGAHRNPPSTGEQYNIPQVQPKTVTEVLLRSEEVSQGPHSNHDRSAGGIRPMTCLTRVPPWPRPGPLALEHAPRTSVGAPHIQWALHAAQGGEGAGRPSIATARRSRAARCLRSGRARSRCAPSPHRPPRSPSTNRTTWGSHPPSGRVRHDARRRRCIRKASSSSSQSMYISARIPRVK